MIAKQPPDEFEDDDLSLPSDDEKGGPEDFDDLFDDDPLEKISLDDDEGPGLDLPPEVSAPPKASPSSEPSTSKPQPPEKPKAASLPDKQTPKSLSEERRVPKPPQKQTPASGSSDSDMSLEDIESEIEFGGLTEDSDIPVAAETQTASKPKVLPKRAILKRGIRCPYCEALLPEEDQIQIKPQKKNLMRNLKDGLKPVDADNPHLITDLENTAAPAFDENNLPRCPKCKKEYVPRETEVSSGFLGGDPTSSGGLVLLVASGFSFLFLVIQLSAYFYLPAPASDEKFFTEDLSFGMALLRLGQNAACCIQPLSFIALGMLGFDTVFGARQNDTLKTKLLTFGAIGLSMLGMWMVLWGFMAVSSIVVD